MVRLTRRHLLAGTGGAIASRMLGASLAYAQVPPGDYFAPIARPAESPASILAANRLVAYYGNPEAASMGILGQLSPSELVAAIERRAATYQQTGGKSTLGAIHMVVTVAQGSPGADGLYRARMSASLIGQYVDLAAQNDLLFVADVQVGRSTVQAEVPPLSEFLQQPHVHLAVDPEFDMWGNQVPGVELGHMTAAEVNWALSYLSNIASSTGRRKILMVHQFAASMLLDKGNIGNAPGIDLAIVMDGWGAPSVKIDHYDAYVAQSNFPYGGMKLFFEWDPSLMTPSQVLALKPPPDIVIYQ